MFFCLFAYVFKNRATLWRVSSNHYTIPENWCNWLLPLTVMCAAMPEALREMLTSYALLHVCRQQGQVFAELMCKVHENGGDSATQAFSLEMPIYLPLTLLQAVLETPWNEPSRKKKIGQGKMKWLMQVPQMCRLLAYLREKGTWENVHGWRWQTVPNIFSSVTTKMAERPWLRTWLRLPFTFFLLLPLRRWKIKYFDFFPH